MPIGDTVADAPTCDYTAPCSTQCHTIYTDTV